MFQQIERVSSARGWDLYQPQIERERESARSMKNIFATASINLAAFFGKALVRTCQSTTN